MMLILKNKYFYLAAAVAIVGGSIGYNQYRKTQTTPNYETVKVARGDLEQTVSATGKIESVDDLSLSFEVPGTVGEVKVKEGDKVSAGAILATLKLSDLNAAVAQASANLNQKLAGATNEDRHYYKAAVDSALATLNQSKVDVAADIQNAESAVETAKNNLKLAEGGDDSQIVNQAYEGTVAILQSSLSKLDDGLTQADNILGIDNTVGNESFKKLLAALNLNLLDEAKRLYYESKNNNKSASATALILQPKSEHQLIDAGAEQTEKALISMNKLLATVSSVLSASITDSVFTPTVLDAKKTLITTTRNAVNTQYDTLTSQKQTITNAKNSYQTYLIAYNKALANLDQEKKNAESAVAIKQAGYDQALANYQSKINPPRAVDVDSFRAALSLALANRDKAIIRAPIAGLVTKITGKKGEFISSAAPMVRMLSNHYEIKVDVPETDIPKIQIGDIAVITLDALGEDVKFSGRVLTVELASTEIQDVVYYRVTVTVDPGDKEIKSGMTANVSLATDRRIGVLAIPVRAIKTNGGKKVQVLEAGAPREVAVELGLRADDGRVEIISGLSEGQDVILGMKK